jgi:hypothetical protein
MTVRKRIGNYAAAGVKEGGEIRKDEALIKNAN